MEKRESYFWEHICPCFLIPAFLLFFVLSMVKIVDQGAEVRKLQKREQELLNKIDQFAEARY